jgi:uncharacterized protein (DUF433 family)
MIMEAISMRPRWFTATEAAALTQLPLKVVNNAIDSQLVPIADGRDAAAGRRLRVTGLLALTLERQLSSYLLLPMRRALFRMVETRPYLKRVSRGVLKIDLREPRRQLAKALRCLRRSRALVTENTEVFGGDPVFKGTRIPVHVVAKLLDEGDTETELREAYPRLTAEMLRLAPLYAAAYPLRGRPRKPKPSDIVLKRTVRRPLKSS